MLQICSVALLFALACATEPQNEVAIGDHTVGIEAQLDLEDTPTESTDTLSTYLEAGDSSEQDMGTEKGLEPGCYYKQKGDNGKCGGAKTSWTQDPLSAAKNSFESEEKCLARKTDWDWYCGAKAQSEWKFVPGAEHLCPAELGDGGFRHAHERSEHCNNDCNLPTYMIDAKCALTKWQLGVVAKNVEYTGNATVPKWTIWKNFVNGEWTNNRGTEALGSVNCPCAHSDGKVLTPEQAGKKILGAIVAMKVPNTIGGAFRACRGDHACRGAQYLTRLVFAKYAYSTQLMLNCWKTKCKKPDPKELDFAGADPILEDIQDTWGGGATC